MGFEEKPRAVRSELLALEGQIRDWAGHLFVIHGMRGWEREDLVQEIFTRAMVKLDKYDGLNKSSLKTWVFWVARNHLCSISRKVKRRPYVTDDGNLPDRPNAEDPVRKTILRHSVKDLLAALQDPEGIKHGYQVLNLLLDNHGNYEHAAFVMTMETTRPWTSEGVRAVVTKIRRTPRGLALCQALGIASETE